MVDDSEVVEAGIARGVAHLGRIQHEDGYWLAGWWGFALLHSYATALVYCGHGPESDKIQDVCDQIEKSIRADGGLSFSVETPGATRWTTQGLQILRYARPSSPLIPRLERFLDREGHDPPTPDNLLARWLLEPASRDQLFRYVPAPRSLRRLAWRIAPRLLVPPKSPPKVPQSKLTRKVGERFFLLQAPGRIL